MWQGMTRDCVDQLEGRGAFVGWDWLWAGVGVWGAERCRSWCSTGVGDWEGKGGLIGD